MMVVHVNITRNILHNLDLYMNEFMYHTLAAALTSLKVKSGPPTILNNIPLAPNIG